jgi:chitinase
MFKTNAYVLPQFFSLASIEMRGKAANLKRLFIALTLAFTSCIFSFAARADLWSTGYYAGYQQDSMVASNIDFGALTHVIHFSVGPNTDGSLNNSGNSISTAHSSDILTRAHAAGKKVLICVGGAGSGPGFEGATTNANRTKFISNLVTFMSSRGYDGIDIDWEPLLAADANQFTNLVIGLRTELATFTQYKYLTAAAGAYSDYRDPPSAEYAIFASVQNQFDQINIMTYDLSGPYAGWVTWFNSPLYDGGYHFPSTGGLLPSVDGAVSNFIANGVASHKLGIGVAFYGYIWSGGSGTVPAGGVRLPRQSWTTNAPTVTTPSYAAIRNSYYQSNQYHWDTNAQAAYLSMTNTPTFISYDDQHTCQIKVSYARNRGLGGVFIWELSEDFFPAQTGSNRAPLLDSLRQSLATPGMTGIALQGKNLQLSFSSLPLALYRVMWTSNVGGPWNTLSNNVNGTGGILYISDPNPPNDPQRFYRVQTPP